MLISEQKHKNKNRKYYHGKVTDKPGKEFYLTTRFAYALIYTEGLLGEVQEYTLKQTADIFNMKCKTDEGLLRKYCQKYESGLLKYLDHLKNNDWTSFSNPQLKFTFIDIIRNLGYDGFFNFEIDKVALQRLHSNLRFQFDFYQGSPAVAVFNKDILVLRKTWSKNNFEDNSEFQELKKEELDIIETINLDWQSQGKSKKEILDYLRKRTLTVKPLEIQELLVDYPQDTLKIYNEQINRYTTDLENKLLKLSEFFKTRN